MGEVGQELLYIVMPAYNEAANIDSVVAEWYPVLGYAGEGSRLVVADGGSTDGTLERLRELEAALGQLEVLSYPGTDHGTKVLALYRHAVGRGADWVFQTDSDGQTVPGEFAGFWELRGERDVIMGDRRVRGDGRSRMLVEQVLRRYVRHYFGAEVPDANAPFRLMRGEVLAKYLDLMPDEFNLPNAVLAACFARYEDTAFREITFQPRRGEKNKMNFKAIARIGVESVGNFSEIRKRLAEREAGAGN